MAVQLHPSSVIILDILLCTILNGYFGCFVFELRCLGQILCHSQLGNRSEKLVFQVIRGPLRAWIVSRYELAPERSHKNINIAVSDDILTCVTFVYKLQEVQDMKNWLPHLKDRSSQYSTLIILLSPVLIIFWTTLPWLHSMCYLVFEEPG